MTIDLNSLERQAIELAKKGDYGPEATRINREIVGVAPQLDSAWTRLGRSYLEQRDFEQATEALRTALTLNPSSVIANNLLKEVRQKKALTPSTASRVSTGFGVREFTLLETLSAVDACRTLKPRLEALFDTLNATTAAKRIVQARQAHGETGSLLFRANSVYPGDAGHIYAYHQGGRWEPQFSLGWFSSPPSDRACLRIGLGFNVTRAGHDPNPDEGQQQILEYFVRFQQVLATTWKQALVDWMNHVGGFLQYDGQPPSTTLLPGEAVEWLIRCTNVAELGWVFCGRWLFLDNSDHAAILSDRGKLARAIDDTFRVLLPIWLSTYAAR